MVVLADQELEGVDVDRIIITPRWADLSMVVHVHQPIKRGPVQDPVERRVPKVVDEEEEDERAARVHER